MHTCTHGRHAHAPPPPKVYGNCNAPPAVAYSAIIYALRCMVTRDVPLNQARGGGRRPLAGLGAPGGPPAPTPKRAHAHAHAHALTRARARAHAHARARPAGLPRAHHRVHPQRVPAQPLARRGRRRGQRAHQPARDGRGAQGVRRGRGVAGAPLPPPPRARPASPRPAARWAALAAWAAPGAPPRHCGPHETPTPPHPTARAA